MQDRRPNYAWVLLPVVVWLLLLWHTQASLVLAGVVLLAAGLAVSLNIGGAAQTMPQILASSLLSFNRTTRAKRGVYAWVAVLGAVLIMVAIEQPDLIRV